MILLSEEIKSAFSGADAKKLVLTFDDGTVIDNEDIALESMELEQSISENDELRFGNVSSACFKTKIKGTTKAYKNLWFNASLWAGEHEMPLGRFFVYTDQATSDRQYRDIVAYDSLFIAMNRDVSEWYNGLTFPISIYDMRNSLFEHLGIEQVEVELANDNILIEKTLDGNGISGQRVIQSICEINACFGCINNVGKFRYVKMRTTNDGLYPSETLYPSDDLFPIDIYDDYLGKSNYYQGSLNYEEYDTKPITKVTIREQVDDLGYSVGEDGNTYVIEDNFLMYGATDEVLNTVATNFFEYAKHVLYTPSKVKCKGTPWREVGDLLQLVSNDKVFTMPILNRVLSGIIALKDEYSAKGTETYGETQNVGFKADLKKIKSRTNVLQRNLDETRSEITRIEENVNGEIETMQSSIKQNAESITTKVSKGDVSSQISQESDKIEIKGDRFVLNATNIQIDANGNVTIQGVLKSGSGSTIGGMKVDSNSIFGNGQQITNTNPSWSSITEGFAFMRPGGSNTKISLGGSEEMSGWTFGCYPYFGVTKKGQIYGSQAVFRSSGEGAGITIYDEDVIHDRFVFTGSEIAGYDNETLGTILIRPNLIDFSKGEYSTASIDGQTGKIICQELEIGYETITESDLIKLKALINN